MSPFCAHRRSTTLLWYCLVHFEICWQRDLGRCQAIKAFGKTLLYSFLKSTSLLTLEPFIIHDSNGWLRIAISPTVEAPLKNWRYHSVGSFNTSLGTISSSRVGIVPRTSALLVLWYTWIQTSWFEYQSMPPATWPSSWWGSKSLLRRWLHQFRHLFWTISALVQGRALVRIL